MYCIMDNQLRYNNVSFGDLSRIVAMQLPEWLEYGKRYSRNLDSVDLERVYQLAKIHEGRRYAELTKEFRKNPTEELRKAITEMEAAIPNHNKRCMYGNYSSEDAG